MKTAFLSLIISLLVAILSVFQFERYQKLSEELHASLSAFEKKININLSSMNQAQQKQDQLMNEISAKAMSVPQNLNAKTQDENFNTSHALEGFRISEAYYLSELAQERLQTTYDVQGARRLLSKAYEDLKSVNNPAYSSIPPMMEKQINALASISLPNVDEIWGTVNTLIEKIDTLPTKGLRLNEAQLPSDKKAQSTANEQITWRQALSKAWEDMKDLIKVQRHTKPIEPILPNEEQLLATEHLRLIMEQMRWSILHNNQIVYERSIQEAIQWINTYFETSDTKVKNFEAALNVLAKLNVKPNLPDLTPILELFEQKGS